MKEKKKIMTRSRQNSVEILETTYICPICRKQYKIISETEIVLNVENVIKILLYWQRMNKINI